MRPTLATIALLALFLPGFATAQSRLTTDGFSAVFPGPVTFTGLQDGKSAHWDCTTNNAVISVSYEKKNLNGKDPFADLEALSRDTLSDKAQSRRLRVDGHAALLSKFVMDNVSIEGVIINRFVTVRVLVVERNSKGYYRVKITTCDKDSELVAQSFLKNFHLAND